jgi:hypothetical protein
MPRVNLADPDFHPETWSPREGRWQVTLAPPDNGAVNLHVRAARVPFPFTIVQEHIRLHEAHHVLVTRFTGYKKDGTTPLPMDMVEAMVEENRVDAFAYHGDIDVNRRHDLCPPRHAICDSPRASLLWFMQFAPTALDREQLVQGVVELDPDAHSAPLCNFGRASIACREWGLDMDVLDEVVTRIWQDPTDATCQWAFETLVKLLEDSTPEVPTPGEGTPEQPPQSGDEKSSGGEKSDDKSGSGDSKPGGEKSGDKSGDGKPGDGKQGGGTPGVKPGEVVMAPAACGARVVGERDGGIAITEAMVRINQRLEDRATAMVQELTKTYLAEIKKRDEGERDRQILTASRATLARNEHRVSEQFVVDTVIMPANKTHFAKAPKGNGQKGEELRQITRWWADRAIFRSRRAGGTVIIDVSGSMRWDYATLREAMLALPSATIAIYCGTRAQKNRPKYDEAVRTGKTLAARAAQGGKLIIVAEKGRWCDPETVQAQTDFTNGNAVDLDSLEWLAKQPGPRVWLGDAELHSGRIHQLWMDLAQNKRKTGDHVRAICRNGRIVRTTSVRAAVEYLLNPRPGIAGVYAWNSEQFLANGVAGVVE